VPVWVAALVKPILPLPGPLTPMRLPPRSVKTPLAMASWPRISPSGNLAVWTFAEILPWTSWATNVALTVKNCGPTVPLMSFGKFCSSMLAPFASVAIGPFSPAGRCRSEP
jgi:hypothetical protein